MESARRGSVVEALLKPTVTPGMNDTTPTFEDALTRYSNSSYFEPGAIIPR